MTHLLPTQAEFDEPATDADLDADLLDPPPPRRIGRIATVLLAATIAAVGFTGGAWVQKNYGTTASDSAAGATGTPPAGFPGFGAQGGTGAAPGGAGGTGPTSTGAGGAGSGDAGSTPAVVGQVVSISGTTLTLKNFAGKTIKVTVPEGTTVTVSSTSELTSLKAGTSVTVTGTTAADGSITANGITSRAP